RVREHEALVVEPVVALDENGVTDFRRERRLESLDVGALQHLDAEFLVEGPRLGVAPRQGGRHRVDRSAGDVLDVDAGPALELVDDAGIEAPAGEGEPREVRVGRFPQRRQEAGSRAGGLGARRGPLEHGDLASGLRQLVRGGAADDPAADDEDLHAPRSSASRKRRVASAGASAAMIAEMTATPRAPALSASPTRSGVMPPMAITGRRTSRATRSRRSSPCGGPYGRLDGVSYTGPKITQSAPFSSASTASSSECTDTPIRSRLSAIARMSWIGSDVPVRCTASAPTARPPSTRSLTIRRAPRSSVRARSRRQT